MKPWNHIRARPRPDNGMNNTGLGIQRRDGTINCNYGAWQFPGGCWGLIQVSIATALPCTWGPARTRFSARVWM